MGPRPIRVKFVDAVEIRMGSPYSICKVRLTGKWVPKLPGDGDDYQNLRAWSSDGGSLALIRWDHRGNDPGFRVVIVAVAQQRVRMSARVKGCCESLEWKNGAFNYRSFVLSQGQIAVDGSRRTSRST